MSLLLVRDKWKLAAIWLLLISLCAIYSGSRVLEGEAFYSDVTALLPSESELLPVAGLENKFANTFENKILLLVKVDGEHERSFASNLQLNLTNLEGVTESNAELWLEKMAGIYSPYSQSLLTKDSRAWLATASDKVLVDAIVAELLMPAAEVRRLPFNEDPANLSGRWMNSLSYKQGVNKFQIVDGFKVAEYQNEQWYIMLFDLNESPYSMVVQTKVLSVIEQLQQAYPDVQLLRSGLLFHAAYGAQIARQEISSIGIGSLAFVLLLIIAAFRSLQPLLMMLAVLVSSVLLGVTVSLWLFGSIHIATLALGSTLIGIAIDYLFHFLVKACSLSSGALARKAIARALAFSVLTTLCAYLMQLQAPFPGLRQMAVFCSAGLIGAWLSVIALAPFYKPEVNPLVFLQGFFDKQVLAVYGSLSAKSVKVLLVVLMIGFYSLATFFYGSVSDDISLLNTSGDELLATEKKVQQIVGGFPVAKYFLVAGESGDELVSTLITLQELLKNNEIEYQNSLSEYLPVSSQQLADWQLVSNRLWADEGVYAQVLAKLGGGNYGAEQLSLDKPFELLTVEQLINQPYFPQVVEFNGMFYTVLYVKGDDSKNQSIAVGLADVYYIDKIKMIETVLADYRERFIGLLSLGLLLVAVFFAVVYGFSSINMIMSIAMVLGLSFSFSYLAGLTVFHLMATLLVIGVSIDTVIFYREMGFIFESWVAATMSSLSSMIAFGLLYLSAVPVLSQFGFVVLLGLFSCWVITPLFFYGKRISNND